MLLRFFAQRTYIEMKLKKDSRSLVFFFFVCQLWLHSATEENWVPRGKKSRVYFRFSFLRKTWSKDPAEGRGS